MPNTLDPFQNLLRIAPLATILISDSTRAEECQKGTLRAETDFVGKPLIRTESTLIRHQRNPMSLILNAIIKQSKLIFQF